MDNDLKKYLDCFMKYFSSFSRSMQLLIKLKGSENQISFECLLLSYMETQMSLEEAFMNSQILNLLNEKLKLACLRSCLCIGESRALAIANMFSSYISQQCIGFRRIQITEKIKYTEAGPDSRIAMRVRSDRPPWYLSVVGGGFYKASTSSAAVVSKYFGYLEKWQIPRKLDGNSHVIYAEEEADGTWLLLAGEFIARLYLDDPSAVRKAEPFSWELSNFGATNRNIWKSSSEVCCEFECSPDDSCRF
ncbi:hypothetical protein RHGRI_017402 [Rhododendron griersonianum]|uniref:Uncharacterized protein n=1 Tax=Rhododendron griersonianum TaxID=479676 RepID=A0AAV6JXN4_9ERIC|nr:hypothetical protein RHGRI_017402 [Rhododendron griersonianum]